MSDNEQISEIKEAFFRMMEELTKAIGMEPIFGRIYSAIILSPDPLTQEDIVEKTGYSRSHVSRYLKRLDSAGLIIRRSKPGSRTLLYESGTQSFQKHFLGFWKRSSRIVEEKVDLINNLLDKIDGLSENSKEKPDVKRLKEVLRVFNARYTAYLEILNDFIEIFEEKMANFKKKID